MSHLADSYSCLISAPWLQYYFETIFPRIPKPVMDSLVQELKALGLPTTPKVCRY